MEDNILMIYKGYSHAPSSSIRGVFKARVLEWVAISFSKLINREFLSWLVVVRVVMIRYKV